MKKVYLSDFGPVVSDSIYSFWRWNKQEDLTLDKVKEIIVFALELGVNGFDLSPAYGNGKIELLFKQAIKDLGLKREDLVLFSKIGIRLFDDQGKLKYRALTEKTIQNQINQSIENLDAEYIDVLLIQGFDPLMNVEEVASVLTSLQLRGKLRHVGVADYSVEEQRLLASRLPHGVVTNHFEFNVLHTEALNDGRIVFAKEQYSKPMAFGPLADGRILHGDDHKAKSIRAVLETIAKEYESNVEQLAVAWIRKLGALPIIGSLDKNRIFNAVTANKIELSHSDWHKINEVIKS